MSHYYEFTNNGMNVLENKLCILKILMRNYNITILMLTHKKLTPQMENIKILKYLFISQLSPVMCELVLCTYC